MAQANRSARPDLAAPGAAETVRAFAELAVQSGVRRLVLSAVHRDFSDYA